jgi:hypothetical protein
LPKTAKDARRIETGACVDCVPVHAAFPVIEAGRHPQFDFRDLLRLHSRYGPLNCSTAQGVLDCNVLALYEAHFSQALMK